VLTPAMRVKQGISAGTMAVEFANPRQSTIHVMVYDLRGSMIARIIQGVYAPGVHQAVWNTRGLARGAYVVMLTMDNLRLVQRVSIK
jgi:hypothetical protein